MFDPMPRSRKTVKIPQRNFKPAGQVEWVQHAQTEPGFAARRGFGKGARAQGLRYEAKAHEHFGGLYGEAYVPGPWFKFQTAGSDKIRWCQPDALLFQPFLGRILVMEYKLCHNPDSWWQLRALYEPVLARAFPPTLWKFVLCEVTKWFDPATNFPESVTLTPNPLEASPGRFYVHIWKPEAKE
jgi:hypothetical protein